MNINNKAINKDINKTFCYIIDQKGNLLPKIFYNKRWFYICKQKNDFFNKNHFFIQLDKIIDKPFNNLSDNKIFEFNY